MLMSPGRRLVPALILWAGLLSTARATEWGGIYATLVTPYRGVNGGIDTQALEREIDHVVRGRVQGLVVLDACGEGEFVTPQERDAVVRTTIRRVFPRVPVIVGIQGHDPAVARQQFLHARSAGAAAVLVQYQTDTPVTEGDLQRFMQSLSDLSKVYGLPIFYDHCPAHSGVDLAPLQVAHILSLPGVVGIREGTGRVSDMQEHRQLCRGMGRVFLTATALNLAQFLAAGGMGAMCPEAVLLPAPCERAYRSCMAGRYEEARSIQDELFALTPIFRTHAASPVLQRVAFAVAPDNRSGLPTGREEPQAELKAALNCMGVSMQALVKVQLPRLTPADLECVRTTVSSVQHIDWDEVELRVPPQPYVPQPSSRAGGMLLRTGAFQLGPGVGKDLTRSQWDGMSGFFP